MPSCFKEDEELQRQIIEMRAALDAKDKAVEKAQAEVAELQSKAQRSGTGSAASGEELAKAKQTIEDLKRQIESAKAQAGAGTAGVAPFKIDMDAIADKLEEDLTRKAKQLRELVQSQIPGGRIDEIALKSIDYPAQLVTPFSSAITFNVVADNGNHLRLLFPVSADLGGSWKLPSAADVQAAYKAAKDNPQGLAGNTGVSPQAPAGGTAPAQPPAGGGVAPQQPGYGQPGGGGMRQVDANTFAFDWGDGAPAAPRQQQAQPQQQQPRAQQPASGPAVISNFAPPGAGGSGGPAAPAPAPNAPAAAPSVPAPVMPVVGDRVIRFDD
ncbi:MAG TPA: hypothetical protein VLE43_01115 [Candidatus Saccharimonadia bacterium]|nr:hypothetical protein [Candidatus Saccharimonadia bacterium]